MSLVFLDGMDHSSGQQVHMKYDRVTWQLGAAGEGTGRFGGQSMTGFGLLGAMRLGVSTTVVSKLIAGLGFNAQSQAGASVVLLQFLWSGTRQVAAHFTASKTLVLFCGSVAAAVASTGSAVLGGTSAWDFVEMEAYWHSTTGSCTVYVSDIPVVSFTGDTTNGAAASGLNQADWGFPLSGGTTPMAVDDFYVLDDQGSTNTVRVGSTCRIRTYYPSADVTVSMTPLTGASNWPMVDETGNWDSTTYVHASAASTYDLYGLGSVVGSWSANETPRGVQVVATALTISGTATIAVQLVLSGVTSRTASQALSTAYTQAHRLVGDTTPGGSAWAVSLMSAVQIGAGYA